MKMPPIQAGMRERVIIPLKTGAEAFVDLSQKCDSYMITVAKDGRVQADFSGGAQGPKDFVMKNFAKSINKMKNFIPEDFNLTDALINLFK